MTVETGLALAGMLVVLVFFSIVRKIPVSVMLILAAIVGALAGGFGIPVRHLTEGTLLFLYLILIVAAGMVFMAVMRESGALEALTRAIVVAFGRVPWLMLSFLMILIMLPAMLTGSAPAAVLTTGVIVAPILLKMGIGKLETTAIVAVGATLGIAAPPINIPAMIISTGVYMPYQGFNLILAVLTFPPAIFTILYLGRKRCKSIDRAQLLEGMPRVGTGKGLIYLPLVAVVLLMIAPRVFPKEFPDLGTPLVFMIGAVIGLFTGKRFNFIQASLGSLKSSLHVLTTFVAVGVLVQIMTLTGVRGLLVLLSLSLPTAFLYLTIAVATPVLGGPLMPFGVASVLGVPLVLAFIGRDTIVVTSAISLLMSLGAMVPPTAISGVFAAQILDEKDYMAILKKSFVPILVTTIIGVLALVFSEQISAVLFFF